MQVVPLVSNPYMLVALVLALCFGLLAKHWSGKRKKDRALFRLCVALAIISVVGGLLLAWRQLQAQPSATQQGQAATQAAPKPVTPPAGEIKQESKGAQSPNIANTGRDVTVTYGAEPAKKPPAPREQKK